MRGFLLLTLANAALRESRTRTFVNVLEDYHRKVSTRGAQGPDPRVKETFLFDCAQVVAVQFEEYLPHSAIRAVCEGSPKRTECLEHSDALIAEFKGQTPDGYTNFTRWCDNFYEWFRMEHGHLCPEQCDKFMCQPRCAWLDQVAELDMREAKLDEEDAAHAELKKVVEMKQNELAEASSELGDAEWRFNQTKDKLARRASDLQELRTAHGKAHNATLDAEAKVEVVNGNISDAKALLEQLEDNKTQLGFSIDRAQLKVTSAERDSKYAAEGLAELEHDEAELKEKAQKAAEEVAKTNKTWHEMVAQIHDSNSTAEAENAKLLEKMDETEEHRQELQAKQEALQQEMNEMAQNPNTTGKETAAKETEMGMLKVELKTALEREQELIVEMAKSAKKLKEVDRESFKANLVRKDLDAAEDDQDKADAKVAGMNASLTEARDEANAARQVADEANAALRNLTAKMGESGDIATQIKEGGKKLKSLEVTLDFAEKARDEKKAAEDAAGADVSEMADKVIALEDEVADLAVKQTAGKEALSELREKVEEEEKKYAVAINSTSAARTALDAERSAVEANETTV